MELQKNSGLICIDFINEIISDGGKLSGKGYYSFSEKNSTLNNLSKLQSLFREKNLPIIHVKIGFSPSYIEHPENSPLFGKAKEFNALELGSWGTEFNDHVSPKDDEKIIVKNRVSAFHNTSLEQVLRTCNIDKVYIAGVATDLAVRAAVGDAHDRDFSVVVVKNCCAAANASDHENALEAMAKIADIVSYS